MSVPRTKPRRSGPSRGPGGQDLLGRARLPAVISGGPWFEMWRDLDPVTGDLRVLGGRDAHETAAHPVGVLGLDLVPRQPR